MNSKQQVICSGVTLKNNSYLPSVKLNDCNVRNYEIFSVDYPPVSAIQASFSGVCDDKYVYFNWEVGSKSLESFIISGTDWSAWGIYSLFLNIGETIIIKLSRETGKIVLAKKLSDITGLPTTDITKLETTGDDRTRGPFCLYNGHLYTTGQTERYASVMKIRCDDLKLVWRKVVTDDIFNPNIPGQPSLNSAQLLLRQILVIPPNPNKNRNYPMVIVTSTSALSYVTISTETLFKLFNYHNTSGKVYGYEDNGNDASLKWDFSSSGNPYKEGDKLSENSFGDNVNSIQIYYPLINGYRFTDGNPQLGIEKTSGTFNLLTGVLIPGNEWEYAKFTFTDGTFFDENLFYVGIVQNGPRIGQQLLIKGDNLYKKAEGDNPQQYQPVVKILYRSQIGIKTLDKYEAYELTHRGGGIYFSLCYEETKDIIIFGTGNSNHTPYGIIHDAYSKLNPNDPNPIVNGETKARLNSGIYSPLPDLLNDNAIKNKRNEQKKYWNNVIKIRDESNYGSDFNRAFSDSCVGISCLDGSIQFALKTNRIDVVDHSITIGKAKAKSNVFYPNGNNQDCIGATIAEFKNKKFCKYTLNGTYLLVVTKSRLLIFDYNKLFNKIVGKTLNSKNYLEGISQNTAFKDALVWEQNEGSTVQSASLVGFAFDNSTLIRKSTGFNVSEFSSSEKPCEVFERGLEVNGLYKSPNSTNPAPFIVAYNIPKIISKVIDNNTKLNYNNSLKWAFSHYATFGSADAGTVGMYGKYSFYGTKQGYMYILNTKNGQIVKILNNDEGFSTYPVIADNVIYGYGGNNKLTPASIPYSFVTKIYTYTLSGNNPNEY